jgi:hypothetical protein
MLWFKSCPRCETGDVVLQRDEYGLAFKCLHCGYMKDIDRNANATIVLKELQEKPELVAIEA